ncbi:MAG: hypothetical protein R3C39_02795 [Dehalococcoidia bacterium]
MRALTLERPRAAYAWLLAALAILGTLEVHAFTAIGSRSADLAALALAVDAAVGLPLLVYLFVVRPGHVSPVVLVPLAAGALVVTARVTEPSTGQGALVLAAGALEVASVVLVALRGRRLHRAYRGHRERLVFVPDAWREALRGQLGASAPMRLANGELLALGLAIAGWRARFVAPAGTRAWSQRSGYFVVLAAFGGLATVELPLAHLLLAQWSPLAAWVVTLLSLEAALQLLADVHAVRLQPHLLTPTHLHLRAGLRGAADIPLERLRGVRKYDANADAAASRVVVFGAPRLVAELTGPVEVRGPFGRTSSASRVAFAVDDEPGFLRAIAAREEPAAR